VILVTSRSSALFKLFAHPAAVFIYTFLFALVAVAVAERVHQILAVISIGAAYIAVSLFYFVWRERISSEDCQREKSDLQEQLACVRKEVDGIRQENEELKAEIPKVIVYDSVKKTIVIKDRNGNADFTLEYVGTNISGRPIDSVRHLLSITENEVLRKNTTAWFDGEEVLPRVQSDPLGEPAYAWRTQLHLESTSPILPNEPIRTMYKTSFEEEYKSAFDPAKKAATAHQVALRTHELSTEILAPMGFVFHPNPEVVVTDFFTALRVQEEENRIIAEHALDINSSRNRVVFKIESPRISYDYRLLFNLAELSKIQEE